jgi:uncharacterized cofD-like protein
MNQVIGTAHNGKYSSVADAFPKVNTILEKKRFQSRREDISMSAITHTSKNKKIVTIGGGSGQFALLSGLRNMRSIKINAVVSMMDSGGSTGRLRDELGILPPGDILKCIVALSPYHDMARQILQKRFGKDRRLKGHNAGNMLLSMLSRYTGSFAAGVSALSEILDTRGTILPVTIDQATLVAELTDGTRVFGEQAIDIPRGDQREKIRDVFLVPHHSNGIRVYPPVVKAIKEANFIVMGPGDLYTSIIPNLIVPGVAESLCKTKARLIYVLNIMTKYGETHHFQAKDFVDRLESTIGRPLDVVIANRRKPSKPLLATYKKQKSEPVGITPQAPCWNEKKVYHLDLLYEDKSVIRHDSTKLGDLLLSVFNKENP